MKIDNPTAVLAVATIVLVFVTYYHMRHAKHMADSMSHVANTMARVADVMVREFEYRISPMVDVQIEKLTINGLSPNSSLKVPISIINLGYYSCYIKNVRFNCSSRDQSQQNISQAIPRFSSETLLEPKRPEVFTVDIQGQSWMVDSPRNYVFSLEMEIAGLDRQYGSRRIPFAKYP
ncbi:MAG: hypothetical protein ACREOW_04900 [Thermodesulfobacteriota bacterium]